MSLGEGCRSKHNLIIASNQFSLHCEFKQIFDSSELLMLFLLQRTLPVFGVLTLVQDMIPQREQKKIKLC